MGLRELSEPRSQIFNTHFFKHGGYARRPFGPSPELSSHTLQSHIVQPRGTPSGRAHRRGRTSPSALLAKG
eukprot:15454723-Alexandrium_andersonii.AAC.1